MMASVWLHEIIEAKAAIPSVAVNADTRAASAATIPSTALRRSVSLKTPAYAEVVQTMPTADSIETTPPPDRTAVSGVGPRVGLAILSELAPEQVALAVASGDAKTLTRASGVGVKLAQRIALELKDKVKKMGVSGDAGFAPGQPGGVPSASDNAGKAVSALAVLGYTPSEAASVVAKFDSSLPTEELIRLSLREMGSRL